MGTKCGARPRRTFQRLNSGEKCAERLSGKHCMSCELWSISARGGALQRTGGYTTLLSHSENTTPPARRTKTPRPPSSAFEGRARKFLEKSLMETDPHHLSTMSNQAHFFSSFSWGVCLTDHPGITAPVQRKVPMHHPLEKSGCGRPMQEAPLFFVDKVFGNEMAHMRKNKKQKNTNTQPSTRPTHIKYVTSRRVCIICM